MKYYNRIIAVLLAVSIAFGLCSCKGGKDAETSAPEAEKQDISEKLKEKFENSAEMLTELSSIDLDITVDTKRTVGTDVYSEFSEQHLDLAGVNTNEFTAFVTDKTVLDGTVITTTEYFSDSKVYARLPTGEIFVSEMTDNAFLARRTPALMIDPSIYGSVSYYDKDESILVFEDPEKLEGWVAPDYAVLTDAVATAYLDKNGFIEKMEYSCTYTRGNAVLTSTYTVTPTVDENTAPELPDEKECAKLDNIDAATYFVLAADRITTTAAINASESKEMAVVIPEGTLMSMSINEAYSLYEKNDDLAAKVDGIIRTQDYTGGSTSHKWTETYKDGKSYYSENESEEKENTATFDDYEASIEGSVLSYLPTSYDFESVTYVESDEFVLLEYTLKNSCLDGERYNEYVCNMLYGDPHHLKSNASDYATQKIAGYIAFDKDAMIPTSMYVEFSGSYTVGESAVIVALTQTVSIDLANDKAYSDAADKPLFEEEPTKKATPLFYTVTAPDGKKMYLFGTIHIGDERTAYLPDEIYAALDESDILALEINTDTFEDKILADSELLALLQNSYYYLDGTTLKDHVPDDLYKAAIEALKISGAYSPYSEITRPSILCGSLDSFLTNSSKDIVRHKGIEERFLDYTSEKSIIIEDIESVKDRLNMDIRYSEKTQEMLLADALSASRAATLKRSNHLFDLWCEGDEKKLTKYIRDEGKIPDDITKEEKAAIEEYNKIMITERDEIMIKAAKEYLEGNDTVFFAVGLAHLLGETGLVDALREAGYTVELVEYK